MLNHTILRSISCRINSQKQTTSFPLNSPITFLVGETRSRKSTFMEALACKIECIVVGNDCLQNDNTLNDVR